MRHSGLTEDDLYGILRRQGVVNLGQVRLVIFEQRGKISVIRQSDAQGTDSELVRKALERRSR